MTKILQPSIRQIEDWHINYTTRKNIPPSVMHFQLSLQKELNESAFELTYKNLIITNELLRASFPLIKGVIKLQINDYDAELYKLYILDDSISPIERKKIHEQISIKFKNLKEPPLVKGYLIKNKNKAFDFCFFIHHIICDAFSFELIKNQLFNNYKIFSNDADSKDTLVLPQYTDFLAKFGESINSKHIDTVDHWTTELSDCSWHINYQIIYRNYLKAAFSSSLKKDINKLVFGKKSQLLKHPNGEAITTAIGKKAFQNIQSLKNKTSISIHIILLAYFNLLSYIVADKKCTLIQSTFVNRINAETQLLIANQLGTLLVKTEMNLESTIEDFLFQIYQLYLDSTKNILYSSEKLDRLSLTTNSFVFLNYITTTNELFESNVDSHEIHVAAESPLYCVIIEYKNNIIFRFEYNLFFYDRHIVEFIINVLLKIFMITPNRLENTLHQELLYNKEVTLGKIP